MQDIILKINLLFQPIATAVTLVYLYSILARTQHFEDRRWIAPVTGGLFGIAAVLAMFTPIEIAPGILVDARNLFVGAAFGLFGVAAGGVTLVMAGTMRAVTGGAGMWLGLIAMVTTAVAALIWRQVVAERKINGVAKYLTLGLAICTQFIVGRWLPPEPRAIYFQDLAPFLATIYVLGALMLGLLVSRERVFQADTKALKIAAETDALTGLLNRRSATDAVQRLARTDALAAGIAVIVFDVDHFKGINDTKGHLVGDAVLVAVTKRIHGCLRPGDLFIRLGGDEFCIVLPCTSQAKALSIASRCRHAIADTSIAVDRTEVDVTISVGVSWTQTPQDLDVLISAADTALYGSKEKGRNTVSLAPTTRSGAVRARHAA